MQKGNKFQRAMRFAENKGFYIILGLCVIAIGVSGYVLFFTGDHTNTDTTPDQVMQADPDSSGHSASGQAPNVSESEEDRQLEQQTTPEPFGEDATQNQTEVKPEDKPTEQAAETVKKTPVTQPAYVLPVAGAAVQREYSGAQLIYDETMCDWRTHVGTDFICSEGDEVVAVAAGTVSKVYTDAMQGNCILIDHGSGLTSLYCGLANNSTMSPGKKVTVGQAIGKAGGKIIAESAQTCHIHLEMAKNGQRVDPMSLLG